MPNSERVGRARSAQKNDPRGDCPSEELFRYYTILSRAVLSQSTQPAKPIGFLGSGQPNPKAKSKSYYSSSRSLVVLLSPSRASSATISNTHLNQFGIVGRHPQTHFTLFTTLSVSHISSAIVGEGGSLTLCLYYSTLLAICQALFFLGYRSDFGDKLGWVNDLRTTKGKVRYCIVHNPLLLQPLGHWFTLIYRKHEHLAVGSSGRGLTRSRGHPLFVVASPSPVVLSLYHTLRHLSSTFFVKSYIFPRRYLTRTS